MSQGFINNDTKPEKNAFKWLYYSVKDLSKILIPRFWKLIVLLTALAVIGRLSGIFCAKILDVLFSLPDHVISDIQRVEAPQVLTINFQFNIFGQTLSLGNIMLLILALMSIYFIKSTTPNTSDKQKTDGFRWLFLFLFFVFLLSFVAGVYSHIKFYPFERNIDASSLFQIAVLSPLNILLNAINFTLSLLITFVIMNSQPIQFTIIIDKMHKTISRAIVLSAFLGLFDFLVYILSMLISSRIMTNIPHHEFKTYFVLETILMCFSGYAIVFAGCYMIIYEKKFWPGLSKSLKLYARVFLKLVCIFILSQGVFWGMNHAFSFINHINELKLLYLQYWTFYPIKYAAIIFIDMLLIKLFMDFSEKGSAHDDEELSQACISNE